MKTSNSDIDNALFTSKVKYKAALTIKILCRQSLLTIKTRSYIASTMEMLQKLLTSSQLILIVIMEKWRFLGSLLGDF